MQRSHLPPSWAEPIVASDLRHDFDHEGLAVVRREAQALLDVELRGTQLVGPVWTWLLGVFLFCYVVLSGLLEVTGLAPGISTGLLRDAVAFGGVGLLTGGLVALTRRRVTVRKRGRLAAPGPWFAASLGGLTLWAVLHNTLPMLLPFSAMSGSEALAFFGINVVEHTLVGLMLASFVRRPLAAFVLGAAFAGLVLVTWTTLAVV